MRDLLFSVKGMTCADCSMRLEERLLREACVASARVSLMTNTARATLKPASEVGDTAAKVLIASAAVLGFPMSLRPADGARIFLHAADAQSVAAHVCGINGVTAGGVTIARSCTAGRHVRVAVTYDAVVIGARHLIGLLGGDVCTHGEREGDDGARELMTRALRSPGVRLICACALTASSISLSLSHGYADVPVNGALTRGTAAQFALASVAMCTYWIIHAKSALGALRTCSANYDTLVTISTAASFALALALVIAAWGGVDVAVYGEPPFSATATLLGIVAIAHELEERARAATRSALDSLKERDSVGGRVVKRARCAVQLAQEQTCAFAAAESSEACDACALGWTRSNGAAEDLNTADASSVVFSVPNEAALPPRVHASLLHHGDELVVPRGEVIPTDGVVLNDFGGDDVCADESMLTGESAPVVKRRGDSIIGGSRSVGALLRLRVTNLPGAGALSHIMSLIADAQASRPVVQARLDAIARIFTPAVVAAAILVLGVWWGVSASGVVVQPHAPFAFALQFALALLVVACPCALALAVAPVTLVATLVGARASVLIPGGGAALEAAAKIDSIIFDKTGTLTEGRASVARVLVSDRTAVHAAAFALGVAAVPAKAATALSTDAALLLGAAAAAALNSSHPLSAAIRRAAIEARITLPESACRGEERHAEAGRGVRAVSPDGEVLLLGAPAWLEGEGVEGAMRATAEARAAGRSAVALAYEGELAGVIELEDAVRDGARDTISRLRVRGLRILIASGDGAGAVERAADAAGVPRADAHFSLSPEGKVKLVRDEQAAGRRVCFVGDGVNDAASITAADVGVAMAGGDASTRSAAAVILQRDDIVGIERLLRLARAARAVVRANVVYSAVYNAVAMPLAAGVLWPALGVIVIPPALAGLGEVVSTLPVLLSSLGLWCLRL